MAKFDVFTPLFHLALPSVFMLTCFLRVKLCYGSNWAILVLCLSPTWFLHVSDDPVESHLRAHVACVIDRLPAGLQREAHLSQLHCCCLVYFWSWEHNKAKSLTK